MSKSEHFFYYYFSLNRSFKIVMCGHAGLNLGCEQSISVTHQPPQDSCSLCIRIRRGGGGWLENESIHKCAHHQSYQSQRFL